jgi:hypothetical protein
LVAALAMVALTAGHAWAQTSTPAAPAPAAAWRWTLSNVTRVESWHFFEPPPTGGDPDYTFVGNRLRVGLARAWRRVDVAGTIQFVQFGGLPRDAFGPGFLGTGGLYFDQSGETESRGLYIPALNVRLRLPRGVTLLGGRFGYTSGAEAPSGRPKVEAVKRARLDSRLVGDFEWSLYQRAWDGVRADIDRPAWHGSAAWMIPTQGGFEEDAGSSLVDVGVGAFTLTLRPGTALPATDLATFVYAYRDDRRVTGRPDNTGRTASSVDVSIASLGASAIGSTRRGNGEVDWLGWVAVQRGSWYEQSHGGWSMALEGGYQWTTGWQPWLRGGYLHASGDDTPGDARHSTFFPMLPTVRRYSFTTAYAPMNLRDSFVEVAVRPTPRVRGRADVRWLRLASAADRWYGGSGATQKRGTFFGYAGRASGGFRDLGTVVEGALDVTVTPHWSINGFFGFIDGGRVVTNLFRGDRLRFGYVESVLQF